MLFHQTGIEAMERLEWYLEGVRLAACIAGVLSLLSLITLMY